MATTQTQPKDDISRPLQKGAPFRKVQEGGTNDKMLKMLRRASGTTFGEIGKALQLSTEDARVKVLGMVGYLGYGLKKMPNGRVKLVDS